MSGFIIGNYLLNFTLAFYDTLPPESVVSVTGLPITPAIEGMLNKGVLDQKPMFKEIIETGVRWEDGTTLDADSILKL